MLSISENQRHIQNSTNFTPFTCQNCAQGVTASISRIALSGLKINFLPFFRQLITNVSTKFFHSDFFLCFSFQKKKKKCLERCQPPSPYIGIPISIKRVGTYNFFGEFVDSTVLLFSISLTLQ